MLKPAVFSSNNSFLLEVGVRLLFRVLFRIQTGLILSLCGCLSVIAQAQNGAKFDGPAELPRVYVNSSLSDTPPRENLSP